MANTDWIFDEAKSLLPRMMETRHRLHEMPELAFEEFQTAAYIRGELSRIGIPYRECGTGTVADIPAANGIGAILLRADIDALPICEETGLPYASKTSGRMHACGHDAHAAMLLGAAELLWNRRETLPGPVRLLFQPAEERGGGAVKMIEAGALEGVCQAYCLHVRAGSPMGVFYTKPGCMHASSDAITIKVTGKSTHGASPHNGVDALVIQAHIVLALQELVSREIGAGDQAVLTLGTVHGGTAENILCGEVILKGTLRALNENVRQLMLRRVPEICKGVAGALRGEAEFTIDHSYLTCVNDEAATEYAADTARALFGEDSVCIIPGPYMGGEDFGFYEKLVPSCKLSLTCGRPEVIHTPIFQIDESAMAYGAAFFAALCFRREQYKGEDRV